MTRVSLAALLTILSIGVVACTDNILKERPVNPAAKAAASKAALSTASVKKESSVCAAYRRQLRAVQILRLGAKLDSDKLKAKELSLNAIIADTCE